MTPRQPNLKYDKARRGSIFRTSQQKRKEGVASVNTTAAIDIITNINHKLKEPNTAMLPNPRSPLVVREMDRTSSKQSLHTARNETQPKYYITDFDVFEDVGVGSYGRVVRAFNKREKREVALKILPKENIAQMKHSDHIVNEREVLGYLSELHMRQ